MGITDRKIRQKEEVRTSILDTAWEIVITEGWPSFSIRKVADAIEYSVPVIYSHFENKEAILLEFNRKGFQLLVDALTAAKAKESHPADQIRAMGNAYWNFAFANKEYYQLMFGLGIPSCDTAGKIPALGDFTQAIIGSIVAMVAPGKTPTFNPWLKYQSFWSMLHGLVSINMVAPDRMTAGHGSGKGHSSGENHELGEGHPSGDGHPSEEGHPSGDGHKGLPRQVLDDVMCSFIRGIEAAEGARPD